MTVDAEGNLYGTYYVGASNLGTVYEIDSSDNEAMLHGSDGANPSAAFADPDGDGGKGLAPL